MKLLIKRLGLFIVIIGVALLAVSEMLNLESNNMLIWSGGLIIGGLLFYLVVNNTVE